MDEPKNAKLKEMMRYLTGFVGWMGLGGSIFQWQPRKQVGFAYVPSLVDWTDLANIKGMNLQACVMRCIEKVEAEVSSEGKHSTQQGDISMPPSSPTVGNTI